jgi:hypothetical protein
MAFNPLSPSQHPLVGSPISKSFLHRLRSSTLLSVSGHLQPPAEQQLTPVSSFQKGKMSLLSLSYICVTLVLRSLPQATAVSPQMCQTSSNRLIYQLPTSYDCKLPNRSKGDIPIPVNWEILRPNTRLYTTKATVCRISEINARYYTNAVGDHFLEQKTKNVLVDPFACQQMIERKTCEAGELFPNHELMWSTKNELKIEYPWPILGSFAYRQLSIRNCFLYDSLISTRYDAPRIASPIGDMRMCDYEKGLCLLKDLLTVVWRPIKTVRCRFVSMGNFSGEVFARSFLATKEQLALTFTANSKLLPDCGRSLRISDQNYAVDFYSFLDAHNKAVKERDSHYGLFSPSKRRVRAAKESESISDDAGLVYSPQLAAQLQYMQETFFKTTSFTFAHALQSVCSVLDLVLKQMHASISSNPTNVMRALLNRTNLHARMSASNIVEVYPCANINSSYIHFLPSNESHCHAFPRIEVRIPGTEAFSSYLDPLTLIISETSPLIACSLQDELPIALDNITYLLDTRKGVLRQVAQGEIRQLSLTQPIHLDPMELSPTIYHNLILAHLNEAFPSEHLAENARVQQLELEIKQTMHARASVVDSDGYVSSGDTFASTIVNHGIFAFLGTSYGVLLQILVLIGSGYSLLLLCKRCLIPHSLRKIYKRLCESIDVFSPIVHASSRLRAKLGTNLDWLPTWIRSKENIIEIACTESSASQGVLTTPMATAFSPSFTTVCPDACIADHDCWICLHNRTIAFEMALLLEEDEVFVRGLDVLPGDTTIWPPKLTSYS